MQMQILQMLIKNLFGELKTIINLLVTHLAVEENVIYAGANDGMLHAFNAETGMEEWGFIPPFIASKLPVIINKNLDGKTS